MCVLAASLSCPSGTTGPAAPATQVVQSQDELVVFFTGNELGSLRPCGCSGGQLGGLAKRPAVFDRVPASRRLLVETGSLIAGEGEQELIKFRILHEALRLLNYDVVHLTGRDFGMATRLGLLSDPQPPLHILQAPEDGQSAVFTRRFTVNGRDITVNIVSFRSPAALMEPPAFVLQPHDPLTVNILILDYVDSKPWMEGRPTDLLLRSWLAPGVECVIYPSATDEPRLLSNPGNGPLVFSVGRFGRYVCRLGITIEPQGPGRAESASEPSDIKHQTSNIKLHFTSIPLEEKLPDSEPLVRLYRQYQQVVAQSDLLESHPRVPLPKGLVFAGSASCQRCHEAEYDQWSTTGHSHALETLKKVGSDRDPECVLCHVIGLPYEGGFVNEAKTPHLANVGCENCHGPGSEHVLTAGQTPPGQPQPACTTCHTPEQSGEFAGHEEEFMKKIVHGKEPAAAGNVKH
ncbi:MAG: hypothetical protein MUC88_11330 [Planctomycetes bacterium]|jgi:hypothetical protein|nr:hypothetical protein [Planctomycetota bacterium]